MSLDPTPPDAELRRIAAVRLARGTARPASASQSPERRGDDARVASRRDRAAARRPAAAALSSANAPTEHAEPKRCSHCGTMYPRTREHFPPCGTPLGTDYHVEHVIPLARGGTNSAGNIHRTCPVCTREKGRMLPVEHRRFRSRS